MDIHDPNFDRWLDEQETEASRVKRMGDWRQRHASDLLLNINHARIIVGRVRNGGADESSDIEALLAKINDLRGKISR